MVFGCLAHYFKIFLERHDDSNVKNYTRRDRGTERKPRVFYSTIDLHSGRLFSSCDTLEYQCMCTLSLARYEKFSYYSKSTCSHYFVSWKWCISLL